tara:strand:- start:734 stop:1405 length:672 start_codon:yes stop_codon:yes gene_type:complete
MFNKFLIFFVIIASILVINHKIFGNIIYNKNDIFITEIEIKKYKKIYLEENNEILNDKELLKKIFLIKKTIKNLIENNPKIIDQIDKAIIKEIGAMSYEDDSMRDYFRFLKIRNEFIYEYYQKKFSISDLRNIFNSFSEINVPISGNNCLTINSIIDLKNNDEFLNVFFVNLKGSNNKYNININGEAYSVCISENIFKTIEARIIEYIELITEDNFKKFIYAN